MSTPFLPPSSEIPCLVVGAGLSGATLARELAEAGQSVVLVEARNHLAGNCHTQRDSVTGVLVHSYGPHVFHTNDAGIFDHVSRFARMRPYRHRVMTTAGGRVYAMPLNLHSINQFFGRAMRPTEAQAFIAARALPITDPQSFEEAALATVGPELYAAFFRDYTLKQWGSDPRDLPASVFRRLPLRFTYEDGYFTHAFQAMPEDGYTVMVARMLDHPRIQLHLNQIVSRAVTRQNWAHIFWTGSLDGWFGHRLGRLGYRTLDFEQWRKPSDEGQGCAVMNAGDGKVTHTRTTEHRHFAPWEEHAATVLTREYPRACQPQDIPFYPLRLRAEKWLLADYVVLAGHERGVTFLGRLGTYRYLDMDQAIREALDCARLWLRCQSHGLHMPCFAVDPLTGKAPALAALAQAIP